MFVFLLLLFVIFEIFLIVKDSKFVNIPRDLVYSNIEMLEKIYFLNIIAFMKE